MTGKVLKYLMYNTPRNMEIRCKGVKCIEVIQDCI